MPESRSPHAVKVPPPVYLFLALLGMILAHLYYPAAYIIPRPFDWLGVPVIAAGLFMTIRSAHLFERHETPLRPGEEATHLVTTGFFRYTRNPMYLGMFCDLFGVLLILGSLTPLLLFLVFILIIRLHFIPLEERRMEETFGQEYLDYKKRVRRWI